MFKSTKSNTYDISAEKYRKMYRFAEGLWWMFQTKWRNDKQLEASFQKSYPGREKTPAELLMYNFRM